MKDRIKAKLVDNTNSHLKRPWKRYKNIKSTAAAEEPAKINLITDFCFSQWANKFGQ
jgi:hypothetical protein